METSPRPELPRAREIHIALDDFVAESGRRRELPTTLHLGRPSGVHRAVVHADWHDAAMRADLVERTLSCLDIGANDPAVFAWLTRPGSLEPHDHDHQWFAATAAAFASHGLDAPDFYVITRKGWRDLVSGEVQSWSRVRPGRTRPDESRPS
ncbi:MAG TPA: hypothetical protein VF426_02545 [Marmoricola sp.]